MSGALAMLMGAAQATLTLSGFLSTTSSSSPVTSVARTVNGSGTLLFDTIITDSGTPQYSKNAGAYANITEGMTLAVTSGDTLAVRAALGTIGMVATFNLKNNSGGALIEAVQLERL